MKALYLVGIIIVVVSIMPFFLTDKSTIQNNVDPAVLDSTLENIQSNLKEVSLVLDPVNENISGIESKYNKAIGSFDQIKKKANKKSSGDLFGSSASKAVTVESLTEILALNTELSSVKSSVEQINNKLSSTELVVANEIGAIKSLLQNNNSITKTGFSYERLLRTISTMMGIIVLFFSYRNDKRQSFKYNIKESTEQ